MCVYIICIYICVYVCIYVYIHVYVYICEWPSFSCICRQGGVNVRLSLEVSKILKEEFKMKVKVSYIPCLTSPYSNIGRNLGSYHHIYIYIC